MDKSYNKYQRAYEIIIELTQSPLPFEPTELYSISNKELKYLKKSLELMAEYLQTMGFEFIGIKEEILIPIYEEIEKRAIHQKKGGGEDKTASFINELVLSAIIKKRERNSK